MIQVEQLAFRYPNADAPTLHGLNFNVQKGEVFGFLGPSGAGKSTTQNILIGLLSGWSGQVEMMGRPLAQWGRALYDRIGVSFELPNHYLKLSAKENLEYFCDLYDVRTHRPETVLEWVGLQDAAHKPVHAFSKGMKNRLSLARSLIHSPELWFLDEPSSGLDPVNVQTVMDLVQEHRAKGVTVLLTTHDMHVAETLCDRVAFMFGGKIVECDSPSSLRQRYGKREVKVRYGEDPTDAQEQSFAMDDLGRNAEFSKLLQTQSLVSIHSQETTLDKVFIELTGARLQ